MNPRVEAYQRLAAEAHPVVADVLLAGEGQAQDLLLSLLHWFGPTDADPLRVGDLIGKYILNPSIAASEDPEIREFRLRCAFAPTASPSARCAAWAPWSRSSWSRTGAPTSPMPNSRALWCRRPPRACHWPPLRACQPRAAQCQEWRRPRPHKPLRTPRPITLCALRRPRWSSIPRTFFQPLATTAPLRGRCCVCAPASRSRWT